MLDVWQMTRCRSNHKCTFRIPIASSPCLETLVPTRLLRCVNACDDNREQRPQVRLPFLHDVAELLAKVIALFDKFTQFVISRTALQNVKSIKTLPTRVTTWANPEVVLPTPSITIVSKSNPPLIVYLSLFFLPADRLRFSALIIVPRRGVCENKITHKRMGGVVSFLIDIGNGRRRRRACARIINRKNVKCDFCQWTQPVVRGYCAQYPQ